MSGGGGRSCTWWGGLRVDSSGDERRTQVLNGWSGLELNNMYVCIVWREDE